MGDHVWDYEEPAANMESYDGEVVVVTDFAMEKWANPGKMPGNLSNSLTTLILDNGAMVRTASRQILFICRKMKEDGKIPFRARIVKIVGDQLAYFTFKSPLPPERDGF